MPDVPYCLVSFSTYHHPLKGEADGGEGDDEVGSESDEDEIMTYAEKFKVVGSSFERRYQQALSSCVFLRTQKKEPRLDVVHEPDNIKDKNALCFQVKHFEKKYVMSYCPLVKVPKLAKALKKGELLSVTLVDLKRKWMPQEKDYKRFATVSILKKGKWEKDDTNNKYNSCINVS